ncbi:multicopper oxidase family protein [Methylococcus geothermalis]|uniref:multicopper oxidase family protein n=1 Tax=Methylococcus geothermalis TaxID=2681310 RepID=UPI001E2F2891|nr:multicopper oxidase family protein [Methylococcus geothermalis]
MGLSLLASQNWLVRASENDMATSSDADFQPNVEIKLTARKVDVPIFQKGRNTSCYKYVGEVIKGPADTLIDMPSYLGPTLRFRKGDKVKIYFTNDLPSEQSNIHWHGLHVPEAADGHPKDQIGHGDIYVYEFEVINRAGTYFYHSHAHGATATQVYKGLAGALIISDDDEEAVDLPRGEYDIPLLIQDRSFTKTNKLSYFGGVDGFFGNRILVNGKPNAKLSVNRGQYRFRCINGSNSRIYKLGWSNKMPLVAIGVDGGLLAQPETRPYIMLAPGERIDLWVDFSHMKPGTELLLRSLAYAGFMPHQGMQNNEHGGMGMSGKGMDIVDMPSKKPGHLMRQSAAVDILKIKVGKNSAANQLTLPNKLSEIEALGIQDADNGSTPRVIRITQAMDATMTPLFNDEPFPQDLVSVDPDEIININSAQYFSITHDHGGMGVQNMTMMSMAHPIHMHGSSFQIVKRSFKESGDHRNYATIKDGFIDAGWKDTVLVVEGEEVALLKRFDTYSGLSLYHCHNLEHEDNGMMRNLLIR